MVAAIVVGLIGGLGEKKLSETISAGAGDFIGAGLVIVLARGVAAIMNNAQITDTVLHAMEGAVSSAGSALFAVLVFVVNLPLAFLIPSTSGHATLAMPILAPLGDFAGVSRSVVITAWAAASGWMNLWVPTTAVVMGGVALAKVGYDKYLRFLLPLLGILFVLICGFLVLGAYLHLIGGEADRLRFGLTPVTSSGGLDPGCGELTAGFGHRSRPPACPNPTLWRFPALRRSAT